MILNKIKTDIDFLIDNEIDLDDSISLNVINSLARLHSDLMDFFEGEK